MMYVITALLIAALGFSVRGLWQAFKRPQRIRPCSRALGHEGPCNGYPHYFCRGYAV